MDDFALEQTFDSDPKLEFECVRAAENKSEVRIHHYHLPKLDDFDRIEYDPDESVIEYRGPATLLNPFLEEQKRSQPAAKE